MRTCIKCNRTLDENLFALRKGQIGNVCKECEALRKKQWYEQNKERLKEQNKANAEKHKAYMKKWHNEHKEQEKEYRKENKEKLKESSDRYYQENKEKIVEYAKEYNNKQEVKDRKKAWYENHIEEKKEYDKEYNKREREVVCASCGKTFVATNNTKYCSDICYKEGYKRARESTYLEKYGCVHPSKRTEAKTKFRQTCIERFGVSTPLLTKECQEKNGNTISKINLNFGLVLQDYNINYVMEYAIIGSKYSYDFYLPDTNTLIEINPTYTHTVVGNHFNDWQYKTEMETYHRDKTEYAISQGYKCINIWQWDDTGCILQQLLNTHRVKLYARNLKLVLEENKNIINDFLIKNHLQGSCYGNIVNLGLYDKSDNLIQVMTFGKPRYNKNYEWELLRLCTKAGYYVVGGAERLFKYFIKQHSPESIVSYCDISKFTGDVYSRLGFKLLRQTAPAKIWSKNSDYITDNLLRQRGFDQLVGSKLNPPKIYGKGTNNEELMLEHGWLPVYDCGQKVFEYKINKVKN